MIAPSVFAWKEGEPVNKCPFVGCEVNGTVGQLSTHVRDRHPEPRIELAPILTIHPERNV